MQILVLLVIVLLAIAAVLLAMAHAWLLFAVALGLLPGIAWLWATEQRWPQRVHVAVLRWKLGHLEHTMDKTSAEMSQLWFDNPGCAEWSALSQWFSELHMERRALRLRIESLVLNLGRPAY